MTAKEVDDAAAEAERAVAVLKTELKRARVMVVRAKEDLRQANKPKPERRRDGSH